MSATLLHHGLSAGRTIQTVQASALGCLYTSRSETGTTGITAAATVGLRQDIGNLLDARVFPHSKLLGGEEQYHRGYQAHHTKDDYCN